MGRRSTAEGCVIHPSDSTAASQAPVEEGIDLEDLAARVYALLRQDLRVERERLGRFRL